MAGPGQPVRGSGRGGSGLTAGGRSGLRALSGQGVSGTAGTAVSSKGLGGVAGAGSVAGAGLAGVAAGAASAAGAGGAGQQARPGYTPTGAKIGRNDVCWCGSGLKYKKCHGR
jgi:preprotein translocase subunit SecA